MNPLLQVSKLARRHDTATVFADVSFTIAPGDRLAVLGASGSGKTTLLRLLAGLETPTRGTIERDPDLRIGMVFQDLALWPNLSVLDNVALALPGLPKRDRPRVAHAALVACHVAELASRKPGTLSIGQQQRVALARAISTRPQLLLLDEPFSSLDPLLREKLMIEVNQVVAEIGAALIIVTHDPFEALALARSAMVLENGRVAEAGALVGLLANAQSLLLRQFAIRVGQTRTGLEKTY